MPVLATKPTKTNTQTSTAPGPKGHRDLSPIQLKGAPARGAKRVKWFAKKFLKIPNGYGAGKPFVYRPFQNEIIDGLFREKGPRPSQGLVSLARGNSKSTTAASFALYALFADNVASPQALIVASDIRQAGIIFNICRRMIEQSPELACRAKIYKDRITVPGNDGLLMPLPADVGALQGWQPTLAIVDELHYCSAELWEAMLLSSGKRPDSLCLAISTPALSDGSVMWSLVHNARETPSADFYFREWTSDTTHATDCQHCWFAANPALGDFLALSSMANVRKTSRESSFRAYRLGQWVEKLEDSWVSKPALEAVLADEPIPRGSKCVLAVDSSYSGDYSAIVMTSISPIPKVQLIKVWKPQDEADENYRVPIIEVENAIRETCKQYQIEEILFDPYRMARTMQILGAERLPVVEFPQSAQRMTPATVGAWEAISNETVEIVRNDTLIEHILNCRVIEDSRGTRVRKDKKDSMNKIDAAVCFIMSHSRATLLARTVKKSKRVVRSVG